MRPLLIDSADGNAVNRVMISVFLLCGKMFNQSVYIVWQYKHIILLKNVCQNDENHSTARRNSNVNS